MAKNDGKDAEAAFEDYWTKRGHCQRLRDKRDLMGINGGARVADFAKPSDFIVSSLVDPLHYAEVKSTTHKTRFSFGGIRPAQSNAALQEAARGSSSYIFYIFSYPLGSWFIMNCQEYAARAASGASSVLFEELTPWHK